MQFNNDAVRIFISLETHTLSHICTVLWISVLFSRNIAFKIKHKRETCFKLNIYSLYLEFVKRYFNKMYKCSHSA